MKNYEEMKQWLSDNRKLLVVALCFVLVFLTGYGVGKYQAAGQVTRRVQQSNYTTPAKPKATTATAGEQPGKTAASSTPAAKNCIVKGNISAAGKKIYHIKGGAFYDRTNPEQCFNTEAEAVSAGFAKSSR